MNKDRSRRPEQRPQRCLRRQVGFLDANERILQPVRCNVPPRRRPAISLDDVCGPRRASRIKRRAVSLVGEARVNRAVDRDAVPGQLAVRLDKVPNAGARLGRGGRRGRRSLGRRSLGRRSLGRDVVSGPRLRSAQRATGCEDHCCENAELRHASPHASTWAIVRR